jgi:hypothetical protein
MGVTENCTNEQIREVLAIALGSDVGRKAIFSLREQAAAVSVEAKEVLPGSEA